MPKLIFDEFSNMPISPQVRYQRRRMATGRCKICSKPAVNKSPYCPKHQEASRYYYWGRIRFVPRDPNAHVPLIESAPHMLPDGAFDLSPGSPSLDEII